MITVEELRNDLQHYDPNAKIRFHTSNKHDLDILSIYSKGGHQEENKKQPKSKFVEIDIG